MSEPVLNVETIPILEEQLQVSRRVVDTGGGVRIRKVVHEDSILSTEPLRMNTVEVFRKSIGRDVEAPVEIRYEGEVTVFPVVVERLVTRKQLVLVEEIHVRRVQAVNHVSLPTTLRREEVVIERQMPGTDEWRIEAPAMAIEKDRD